MITIVDGNILDAKENVIGHQTNCRGVMGSGLALQIRNAFPVVYKEYRDLCSKIIARKLLGSCQFVKINDTQYVANIFGQLDYGRSKMHTDYEALSSSLKAIVSHIQKDHDSVALPYNLGCSLAGGDWNVVYPMIEEIFKDYDVTIYKLL